LRIHDGGITRTRTTDCGGSDTVYGLCGDYMEIKPYYEEPGITIYHGDCREILPHLPKVDVVLTDPPYGIEGGRGGQLKDYRKADYTMFVDDANYINTVCRPVIDECLKIAKTVVFTPGTRCSHSYPQPDEIGGFYTPAATRIGLFGWSNLHPIFFYGFYKNRGKGALHTVFTTCESAPKNGHPCPKPIKAWTWLLNRCSEVGDTILDPFMGSGTTLVAAKQLNRKAIGIEIEQKYCDIAIDRLRQEVFDFK